MSQAIQHTRTEKLLLEAARVFNSTLDYEELTRLVLRLVINAVDSEIALLYRLDTDLPDMKLRLMRQPDYELEEVYFQTGTGTVGWVVEHREPVIMNDPAGDLRLDPAKLKSMNLDIRNMISLPLIGRGHMIGVVEAINKQNGGFGDVDLDILTGLNNQIAVAIENAHLYRKVRREALEKTLLYETGKKLSGSLKLEEVLQGILVSLKQVVKYVVGGVFLVENEHVDLKSVFAVGYAPHFEESLHMKGGQGIVGAVAISGEPVIVPDVAEDPRYINANPETKSEIVVPIKVDDRVIGVINLESDELNAYGQQDVSLITAFASQAGISLERARLHENLLAARKLEEQLNVARIIQRTFLPDQDPAIYGYDIHGRNISSGQVGGDYYDFIRIVDNHYGIAIADVSGKGIPAALIMASFRASLIAEIRNNYSIRTIGEKVNSLLCESLEPGNFVTGVYGVLDARHHVFTFSNFGHNPPLLLRQDGTVELLKEGGPVLGVTTEARFEQQAMMLNPGDIVVLFTDGVTEVFDREGQELGMDGLTRIVKEHASESAVAIADAIHRAVTGFASPDHVFDDITMIVVKRLPN